MVHSRPQRKAPKHACLPATVAARNAAARSVSGFESPLSIPPAMGRGWEEGQFRYTTGMDEQELHDRLTALGVPFAIIPCDPALADTANFCAAYGYPLEDSANTILVTGKVDPPVYAACVVLAHTRLDVNRTVRQRLGVRKASFAPAEETRALTGMEIGGVTVFGLPPTIPIWVDVRVMARERIILGGGSRSCKVIATPDILRALPNVEVIEGLAGEPAPAG